MRASYEQIVFLVDAVADVPGDFAELGIWLVDTFMPLAEAARASNRKCHAVDTFCGMMAPVAQDRDAEGRCAYAEGQFDVGGSAAFRKRVAGLGVTVCVWEGAVPGILSALGDVVLAFSHLDMDHYMPTRYALDWAWAHSAPGGIVCCHDWMRSRDHLAAAAIKHWMKATGLKPAGELRSGHCWFVKEDEHVHS